MMPQDVYKHENRRFFEQAPAAWLVQLAEVKGLSECAELEILYPHIADLVHDDQLAALEIGFGYGRVIDWILKKNPQKPIIGVDHSEPVHARLVAARRAAGDARTLLVHGCITDLTIPAPINLALWMWAGIFELSDDDKARAISNVAASLIPGGKLAIEFPDEILGHDSVEHLNDGKLLVKTEFGSLNVFRTPAARLAVLCEREGLTLEADIAYVTSSHIPRRIAVLTKARP